MSTRLLGRPTGTSPIVSARHSSFPRAWSPNEARWEPRRGVIPELLLDRTAFWGRQPPVSLDKTLIARGRRPLQEPMPQFRLGRSSMPLGLRPLAQPLAETPAVALEVERLIDAIIPQVIVQPADDLGTRSKRALVVRVDVIDVHGDVLGGGAGPLRAERAMGALRAEPNHAVTELDHRVIDRAVGPHAARGRDLTEPERPLQERERGTDVLIRKPWNDRWSSHGLDLLPDCGHEHCLSPVERRRRDRGLAPQLPHQIHPLHRDLTLLFPSGSSSSRRCARARLSRERTVPIGSSSASATLWYERSSHAKSRSADRSSSGSASIASATRGKSRRASSAAAPARLSGAS